MKLNKKQREEIEKRAGIIETAQVTDNEWEKGYLTGLMEVYAGVKGKPEIPKRELREKMRCSSDSRTSTIPNSYDAGYSAGVYIAASEIIGILRGLY